MREYLDIDGATNPISRHTLIVEVD